MLKLLHNADRIKCPLTDIKGCSINEVWTPFAPIKHFTVTLSSCYTFFKFFFALYKCDLLKKIFLHPYNNLSQNISKYASDTCIDHAVTFSSKKGKQYQIE